jgi:small subunit ribosomal protein S6
VKQYELVVLLHPDLEIDIDTPIGKVEKLVEGVGGKITKRDSWGKKRLAYPIKKQQFGLYVYFELDLEPAAVRQLESSLLITEEVLRFLVVNRVVTQKNPTAKTDKSEVTAETAATSEEK